MNKTKLVMDRGFYPALFILGIFHWIIFLNGGHLDFAVYDWQQEFYYLSSLKLALLEAKIPWRILPIYPKAPEFMGNPEICWAPQILLLRWMHPGTFVVFNACLLYSIGFVGCMALGRSLSLSRSSFAVLWLLLSFNGHITAHMARGHHMWLGYYYLPWLLWAFWKWTQNHNDPKLIRYLALIFFGMILQGSFHLAFGSMLFFVFLGMSRRKWWRGSAVVLVLTVLLSAIRFLPALDTLGLRQTDYRGGYLNIKTLLSGFTMLLQLDESKPTGVIVRANWHEYDVFIGWTGFTILALGLWSICISFLEPRKRDFRFFSVPIILLVIMSWGDVWKPFFELPLLGVERFSTRLIILPVAALLTLGVYELDQHMKKYPQFRHLVWMFAFALAIELGAHSWVWRHAMFISGLPEISFPGGGLHIIDSGIPGFKNRFFAVAIISMVTLAATVYWPVLMQKNGVLANLRKMRD